MPRPSRGPRRTATCVVNPTGEHQATIVWLHSLGETGVGWEHHLVGLQLPNIKWICPTAPIHPAPALGSDSRCPTRCEVADLSVEESPYDDLEGLDASAAHVANLLASEPTGIKLGVGGFGMGAAVALHSATCFARGRFHNGNPYPNINLTAVLGLNGWLPQASHKSSIIHPSRSPAALLPIFLAHGLSDSIVHPIHSHRAQQSLSSSGFQNITYRTYERVEHFLSPDDERTDIRNWLNRVLQF